MRNEDAIKWLENLKQDIGQLRHENLWPYAQAIEEIMGLLEEQEKKWIPVSERMPGNNDYVLCTDGKWIDIGFANDGKAWHCDPLEDYVTHWMPLPQPPKEGDGE